MSRSRRKEAMAREIEELERKFDSWNRDSGLWIILSHARLEWANGRYDQCAQNLAEIRLIAENVE